MPPARKRGSQEQERQLQAYTACRCRGGCRRRQMTTTSLHGLSSFVALNKRKGSTLSRNCKRGGGLSSSLWWVQTEADDDDEPTWLVVVRCLKKKEKDPPRLAIASEGVGYCRRCGGCRRRQMTTTSLHGSLSFVALNKRKGSTPSRNCKRGGGLSSSLWWVQTEADDDDEPTWLVVVRCLKKKEKDLPRLAIASEGVGYCRCRGCRRRQMMTTSLHGSSSFIALKKRNKKPTLSRNCKRGGGLLSLSWVQTEADDDDEPTWLVVVRCLKEKEQETHPVSQLQARGWVFVICIALSLSVISNLS